MSSGDKFDWKPIEVACGFGLTIAVARRLNVTNMVSGPVIGSLGGVLGSYANDVGTVVAYGALFYIFDKFIKDYITSK